MFFNIRVILNILGTLVALNGMFMFLSVPFSVYYGGNDLLAILLSGTIAVVFGFLLWLVTKGAKNKELRKREGYLVVTSGWLIMSLFGSLPYLLSGSIPHFTDAFFETLSGYSTTGASILTDIESIDKGILFWRSLTQWIGGMGIIVLTVAILPIFGIGGMQLFIAEAPGISPDKLQPRIKETAKRLWYIYLALTASEIVLLMLGGMSFYDAMNHSMTTMSSGGFSTKNESIAHFDSPFIQYVIILFMIMAGTNFTMTYLAIHGQFEKIVKNEEFRTYLGFLLGTSLLVGFVLYGLNHAGLEQSFRDGMFQVVSIITTTGYVTYDYTTWTNFIHILVFVLMFVGASAGSTAGGVKVVRHLILIKNSILELKKQIHPSAVIPVRYNDKAVAREITFNILAFIMIYISIFALGSIVMGLLGLDFISAMGSVATCLGNVGPGVGSVGPSNNFAHLPDTAKWFLSFLMLLGRLELFTVLILFTPYFWRKI